jgi:hypothetical protein
MFKNFVFIQSKGRCESISTGQMAERLRRQVKVSILTQIPGHESGVGSIPTLIISFCTYSVLNFILKFCCLDDSMRDSRARRR